MIRASVELLSMTDEERPRGVKSTSASMESQDSTEESPKEPGEEEKEPAAGQSDAKRAKRVTREEREDAMLPHLKPAPGKLCNIYCFFFNILRWKRQDSL